MSISEKNQMNLNSQIYEQRNRKTDRRLTMIYDRYHTGKSIIIDDLKYVCLKDPDGCNHIVKNIVESDSENKQVIESNLENKQVKEPKKVEKLEYAVNKNESSIKLLDYPDRENSIDTQITELKKGLEIMSSLKSVIDKMDDSEKIDMLANLYEALELKKLNQEIKFWNDTIADRISMYTYSEEKEFDVLV
jgi:hypothetical protein